MRGAAMNLQGALWALDARNDEAVKVNHPATGALGGALALGGRIRQTWMTG